jgi:hypothetical protein
MGLENFGADNLPKDIVLEEQELKTNSEGKEYLYEKDGVFYGGDYLNELPNEIDLNLPEEPEEKNSIL